MNLVICYFSNTKHTIIRFSNPVTYRIKYWHLFGILYIKYTIMKKIYLLLLVVLGFSLLNESKSQLRLGLNINVGMQPKWGPSGYDHVDYYYMPDIDVYYNVPAQQYIYFNNGRWN